jgi:MFS family permease
MLSFSIRNILDRNRISRELIALYTHRVIARAGLVAVGVFTVIFVYEKFNDSLWAALVTFGAIYFGQGLLSPLGARLLRVYGTRTLLFISLPFMIAGTVILFIIAEYGTIGSISLAWSMAGFGACVVCFRVLYWVPYHVDMSQLLDNSRRGTQLALLQNTGDFNIAVMPFWAGLIVASFGFGWLFILSIILVLFSALPLFWVSNRYEEYSWSYAETLKRLFARRNRTLLLGYIGDGIQWGVQLIIWPLFVFLLLDGKYVALGAVAALTLFIVLVLRIITANFFDKGKKRQALRWGAVLSSSGWVLRLFVASPFTVVAVDTYYGAGQVVNRISVDAMTYEQASDNGRFVDEFTVLKEMALNTGKALSLVLVGIFAWFGGIYFGFAAGMLLAAGATLWTTRLAKRVNVSI